MTIQTSAEAVITELRRSGDTGIGENPKIFRFTGRSRTSIIGDLQMTLLVETVRRNMPGSNVVVEQALAATWQPFEIKGEWDDKWAGDSYAMRTFTEFAEFVSRAPLVRFEFDEFSYVGMLTQLSVTYKTRTKIGWSVTISPHKYESLIDYTPIPKKNKPIPKWVEEIGIKNAELNTQLSKRIDTQIDSDRVLTIGQLVNEVNQSFNVIDSFVNSSSSLDNSQVLLVASLFRRGYFMCQRLNDELKIAASSLDLFWNSPFEAFRHMVWRIGGFSACMSMMQSLDEAAIDAQNRANARPIALYYPKAGENLERISSRFYGSPAHWKLIYDYNGLTSIILYGDEELLIPERSS